MKLRYLLVAVLTFFCLTINAQPGALDKAFGSFGISVSTERSIFERIFPLSGGKFLVTEGELAVRTYPNGATESYTYSIFRRYNADGTADLTYGYNGARRFFTSDEYHQWFTSFAVLSDGRIVATESAQVLGGNPVSLNRIWIISADGATAGILAELSVLGYFAVRLNDITVDKNNRVVVTGYVRGTMSTDKNRTYIARLNSDGSFDETFFNGGFRILVENSSYNYEGRKVVTDANNNIILWEDGYYAYVQQDGSTIEAEGSYISKFKENGSRETSFPYVKTNAVVRSLLTDGNSEIIYLNNSVIKRLNTDGSLDLDFSPEMSARKLVIQPDNKIIAIGGNSVFQLARFGTNGTPDPSFGTNGYVTTDLNLTALAVDAIYRNRRIYLSGYVINGFGYGTIAAYDGSDVRMTCPSPQNPYNVDAGKCYATVNGINAIMSTSTLYANVQHKLEYNGSVVEGEGGVAGKQFQKGTTKVTYTYTDITTQTCSFNITVEDKDPPVARCKNVTVQLDASGNGTLTAAQVDNGSTDGCGIQSRVLSKTSFSCSDPAINTVTLTVTDIHGNTASCTATVTVEDKVPPVAKCKNITVYLDATGNVSITSAQVDDGSTDACGIKSLVLSKTSFDCSNKGNNQVTLTVTDNNNNVSTCNANVLVVDNLPPIITAVVPTPQAIWPSDRKMKPVTVSTTSTDNCPGTTCKITAVAIKQGEFAGDNIGPDWEITGNNTVNLRAEIPKRGVKRIYTITVTCTDAAGNESSANTDVIVSHNIITPASGASVKIGTTVSLTGEFWDVPGKTHTAKWLIDDKTIGGIVTEPSGINNGAVAGSYKFTAAGVYKLRMNVTDQYGVTGYSNTNENLDAILVVYDPNGGYTYGGGKFTSPQGALIKTPSATGEATYGFTVNYKNGALPKGETQFDFKVGDFEFNALNFDYLAISNAKAQFKGTGKIIGGQSGIGFIMTVIDGALDGTGVDKIRMKVFNRNTGQVYYDNQPGASDAASPTQPVGANSIVVISGSNGSIITAKSGSDELENERLSIKLVDELTASVYPNPASSYFNVLVNSNDVNERIILQVYDLNGRLVEVKNNVSNESIIRLGDLYKAGVYYVKVIQGKQHKELKLVKLN
ncbi:T9SS type A sorting domain-containing protein [Lacibacter luteus]|nr:T9SS type A sorting domain-containing protein [Lacibacter luteus]